VIGGPADLATGPVTRGAVRVQGPVGHDGPDDPVFRWWLRRAGPVPAPAAGWLELLRAERAAGLRPARVVVLPLDLGEHEHFLCRWWWPLTVEAGEDVVVVDPGDGPVPDGPTGDFWVVDDARVVVIDHDRAGRFRGTRAVDPVRAAAFVDLLHRLVAVAEPFGRWRARTDSGRCRGLLGAAHRRSAAPVGLPAR
jgi:hypothetical protein